MGQVTLPSLERVAAVEAWKYLLNEDEDWANAVAEEVNKGRTPDEIFRGMVKVLGPDRTAWCHRLLLAAEYLTDG